MTPKNSAPVLDRIATIVSFQELIHTSYFDHSEIIAILAAHVLHHSKLPRLDPAAGFASDPNVLLPPLLSLNEQEARIRYSTRHNLELVAAVSVFIVPAILLTLAGNATFDGKIAPETDQFQIQAIATALAKAPERKGQTNSDAFGEIIVRLSQLGEIKDPVAALEKLVDQSSFSAGAPIVANYLGELRNWDSVERLLVSRRLVAPNGRYDQRSIRLAAISGAVSSGHADLSQNKTLRDMVDSLDAEASSLLENETTPRTIENFPWSNWGSKLAALKEYERINRLLFAGATFPDPLRKAAVDKARCLLAAALRAHHLAQSVKSDTRAWVDACKTVNEPETEFDALLEEAVLAPHDDYVPSESIGRAFENVPNSLEAIIEAVHRRDGSRTPELRQNILSRKKVRQLSQLYRFAVMREAKDKIEQFHDAIDEFLKTSDDAVALERTAVILRLLNIITAAEKKFPQDPRWMATLRFATSVVLKQSATIIGDTEVGKDFDENSLFVEVPRLLVAAGQDGVARQFFRDVSWRLEGQYKGVLSAFVSLHLAAAAKAIDYREFELARLLEGWEALKASSDSRSDDEDNLADVAVFAALTSGAELPDYTRRVLTFAEGNVQFVKEKWSESLPDMVRLWVALGELPKARSLVVEKASTVSASMDLYPPILDKIISDRKRRPLAGLRISN